MQAAPVSLEKNFQSLVETKKKEWVQTASRKWLRQTTLKKLYIYIFIYMFYIYYIYIFGHPWWSSGEESICQCREHRFDPWSWKISHAMGQLSLWATTAEPTCPRACALREKPPQWEAWTLQLESIRCLPQSTVSTEGPRAAMKTQRSQK